MTDNVKRMKLDGMTITLARVSLFEHPEDLDQFHEDCKHNIFEACAAFIKSSAMMNDMARNAALTFGALNHIEEATKLLRTAFKVKLLQYVWQWDLDQLEGARDVEWSFADDTFEIYILREEGYLKSLIPDVIIEF